ncbi:hypothetical protein SAMN06298216_3254 [Spirosomataceae bacterium TFI 002]|nr:hypothetical protein SAMN06298216_3254 [Spirosomataceae bacterium TFI 002]
MKTKLLTVCGLCLVFLAFLFAQETDKPFVYHEEKHKGMSFVAPPNELDSTAFDKVSQTKTEWISLMPYGFVGKESSEFRFAREGDTEEQHRWWGERPDGVRECIRMAKKQGLKIMMKPHMWIGRGTFTGDFVLQSEAEWELFERTYKEYLLQFARISEEEGVEAFCMATEMHSMVRERPDFWIKLISEIRAIYSGELTYAENWDCYEKVPFWGQLDYIGVDAYFPLAKGENPSLEALKKGWKPWLKNLKNFASKEQKAILFTEIGYRSCDFSTEKPWETNYDLPDNDELQLKAYQAFYEQVWEQDWFAGAYLWKWFAHTRDGHKHRDKFAFQEKPAVKEITKMYGR